MVEETAFKINGRIFRLNCYPGSPRRVETTRSSSFLVPLFEEEGWFVVETLVLVITPVSFTEVLNWLNENVNGYYIKYNPYWFMFTDEADAVAFKLRWC